MLATSDITRPLVDAIQQVNDMILADTDPVSAINAAADAHEALLDGSALFATTRRGAVRRLRSEGWKLKEIAEACGLTPARIYQIESGADRKEKG